MTDMLERERLVGNLIDQVFKLEEEVARLKEQLMGVAVQEVIIPEPATGGRWRVTIHTLADGRTGFLLEEIL